MLKSSRVTNVLTAARFLTDEEEEKHQETGVIGLCCRQQHAGLAVLLKESPAGSRLILREAQRCQEPTHRARERDYHEHRRPDTADRNEA